jgi:hypothetical protein
MNMKMFTTFSTKRNRLLMKKLPYAAIAIGSLILLATAFESNARDMQSSVSNITSQNPEQTQPSPNTDKEISAIPRHVKRIQFKPGTSSTLIENAVVRGERDIYLLKAKGGQRLHGQVTSAENNAVFDVLTPNGKVVRQEVKKVDMTLPGTGDFQIVVGGTRGNATYQLNIGVD